MTPADPYDPPPTQPLRAREPHAREGAAPEAADAVWVARLEGQVRSLKGIVALLGVLALAAIGVAVWALLSAEYDGASAAGAGRVARLDDRVDQLENEVDDVAKATDTGDFTQQLAGKADQADLQAVSDQVDELAAAVDASGSDDVAAQLAELQARVDALAQQLEALSAGGP
jgi:uncharacterized protein YceH (UPF0502 family)